MLYSEAGEYKLHVVSSHPAPPHPGLPKKLILTVNHVTPYTQLCGGPELTYVNRHNFVYPKEPPTEDDIKRFNDWKVAGDKRKWRISHVQQLQKAATKSRDDRIVSYLFILEQVYGDKELIEIPPAQEVKHLRRFNNLIMEDGV